MGISAVLRHIEVAESHFSNAQAKQDKDLFTDVVYRSNHAFEGILKEAYAVLAKQNPDRKTPHEIEEYLIQQRVFRDQVITLFTKYREDWRNPSTHQYQLTFTEQEAFLSLMSVSSFVCILLDQMIETAAFDKASALAKKFEISKKEAKNSQKIALVDQVAQMLIPAFSRSLLHLKQSMQSSSEIHGMLHAFIISAAPDIQVEVEPSLKDKQGTFRPDFLLAREDDRVVIEIVAYRTVPPKIKERRREQLIRAMDASGAKSGIIFSAPVGKQWAEIHDVIISEPIGEDRMLVEVTYKPGRLVKNELN